MSFSENTDSDWKEIKTAQHLKKTQNSGSKLKYSQKFCEKWLSVFTPWLARSDADPNKPFCRVCQCRLDCNRCHLLRHERTTKHKRNLEALLTNGEGAVRMEVSVRQERSKYYQRKRAMQALKQELPSGPIADEPYEEVVVPAVEEVANGIPDSEQNFQLVDSESHNIIPYTEMKLEASTLSTSRTEISSTLPNKVITNESVPPGSSNKDGLKLLMQIHQDKNELMESFRELMGTQLTHNQPKEKNHVDLFFESVSSSVKALSPKLIAEAKMRVSQLICELELRGLKDDSTNLAKNESSAVGMTTQSNNTIIVKQTALAQHQFDALS